ncbi:hypothetical protein niasHS_016908 [Heterodera schachtii]|uniref:Uncharacterized protein n=1 Tax=Heterodera schachtii TaxID=97005 RepID=A0ABD2HTU6_HETSC
MSVRKCLSANVRPQMSHCVSLSLKQTCCWLLCFFHIRPIPASIFCSILSGMDSAWRRLVSAIDGIKAQFTDGDSEDTADLPSTANSVPDQLANIRERVEPAHCQLSKIVRHGFPDSPKCMALQKLCVIGSCNGCVRLFGQVSPVAPTKLLIVFDRCQLVLWNIQTLEVDRLRLDDQPNSPVIAVSWHFDGKQLMAGHHDVSIWNVKKPHEMVQHSMQHGGMTNVQQNQQKHDNHKEKTAASAGDQQQQRHRSTMLPMPSLWHVSRSHRRAGT